MSNNENYKIRWTVTDPQKRIVVCLDKTYLDHVEGDHSEKDAGLRRKIESCVKETVKSPQYIYEEFGSSRHLYYNVIAISENVEKLKMKLLKVVVDADREPNEVVTWTPLRKGDKVEGGAMIYERGKDDLSD